MSARAGKSTRAHHRRNPGDQPLWRRLLVVGLLLAALAGAGLLVYANSPYDLKDGGATVDIPQGSQRAVARSLVEQGIGTLEWPFWLLGRATGLGRSVQAGRYRVDADATPYSLLEKMVRGDSVKVSVTLVEGWRFAQVRSALAAEPGLRHETADLGEADIMAAIGASGIAAEGRFMPDTYLVSYGTSDKVVLRMAYRAMQEALATAWADRSAEVPVRTPDEALILASIVEKETGVAEERPMIAGVFGNRLRRGMLLQTDPTVIYGLGESFNGNLTRADLERDTPWNTYTRSGLPPTPIAMPGRAALAAATRPARTDALYFVATGEGRHTFSTTLEQHNTAVARLVRRMRQ